MCGNVNVETVVRLSGAELPTEGGFLPDSMTLNVSGVGANLARALLTLQSPVRLLSFAADALVGQVARLAMAGAETHFVPTSETPQSLVTLRPDGQHRFYRDLGDTPTAAAPKAMFQDLVAGCSAALLTNIGWTRELLPLAQAARLSILTDVQDIRGPDHPYDQAYFAAADVLFLSAEHLPDPATTMQALQERHSTRLIVAGLGRLGALLLDCGSEILHQPAFPVPIASQGGAGDTLAAAFAHFYFSRQVPARQALRFAAAAAALKLSAAGSGTGHPNESEVLSLAARQP